MYHEGSQNLTLFKDERHEKLHPNLRPNSPFSSILKLRDARSEPGLPVVQLEYIRPV